MKKRFSTRLIMALMTAVPLDARRALFRFLFMIFYHLSPKHRIITISNLSRAFPEMDVSAVVLLSKAVYSHFGVMTSEIFEIPFLTKENISKLVDVEDIEKTLEAFSDGPLMILTGHQGNWELLAATLAIMARPIAVIYRPLDSPALENLVTWIRTVHGNSVLPKERAMRPILRHLKDGGAIGILIDQNTAWQEGVFVDFFGQPACTTDGAALVALHSNIPVLSAFMMRQPAGKYRLIVKKPAGVVKTGDKKRDVLAHTGSFTRTIEQVIREYPEQWLWMHQRWKTKKLQAKR